MACSLCGVRGLDIPCSAHIRTGSQTCENQRSKQVTVASSTSPYERFDGLYPIPDYRRATLENKMLDAICKRVAGTEIIIISEKAADVICDQSAGECADYVPMSDENQRSIRQNQKRYAAMVVQPHHYLLHL